MLVEIFKIIHHFWWPVKWNRCRVYFKVKFQSLKQITNSEPHLSVISPCLTITTIELLVQPFHRKRKRFWKLQVLKTRSDFLLQGLELKTYFYVQIFFWQPSHSWPDHYLTFRLWIIENWSTTMPERTHIFLFLSVLCLCVTWN